MSAATLERQFRPIYESLDNGSNKSAVVSCNKLLKKYPNNLLLKSLKALALVRSQKVEESLALCDEVLAAKSLDDATLSAMMHVLKALGKNTDMINMCEDAYKQQPQNEEYGAQAFFAHVRTTNWKSAQQISTRMHKQFQEDRYLYWSVIGAILQANDPATAPNMRTLLYKLAHRLVTSSPTPSYVSADRFHMHISILKELELFDEANTLLESEIGKAICSTSLACNQTRREIWRMRGLFKDEGAHAQQKIMDGDRDWLEFISVLDATFTAVSSKEEGISEEGRNECMENIKKSRAFFTEIAQKDGKKNRAAPLALLELEHRAYKHNLSDENSLLSMMEHYFTQFGDKACCYEDLLSYLDLEGASLEQWTTFLTNHNPSFASVGDVQRLINVRKLQRYKLSKSHISADLESARGMQYLTEYMDGLSLGAELPVTELQPADDLAILAAHAFVNVWKLNGAEEALYHAVVILEFSLTKSQMSYQMRMMLIRIYRILGAPSLALEHYRLMNVKQVQNDTLSHLILTRALTFSLAGTGDLTYSSECLESSQIYLANSQETSDFIVRAFTAEKYTQIPDFIEFEDRLENSLQRDVVKLEHVRMRLTHEQVSSDIIDMELIELKFIFDRLHHDNRDFFIIPNYQPACQPSFNEQSLMFGKSTGKGWLWSLLKIYIRAFQHASDLDEIVEEKLLIGDRPKKSPEPEVKLPLAERLAIRKPEEVAELTSEELQLLDWATALGDWLEPHHNHTRPPPAVVLAEASRQTELKTGLPLRGVDLKALNGDANGHLKKDEEAPPIKEVPELVTKFFENMNSHFKELLRSKCLPSELLHVATITQEAFILFAVETLRFKAPAIVKIHKLGNLVQMFKDVRAKASCVVKEMSTALVKAGEAEGTSACRKAFVQACAPVTVGQIKPDFVLNVAKNVTESRKKVLEGVGKGMAKLNNVHGQS
ncbi:N-acetyltransferase B complex non catalytic subunit-domain-containing protein [Phlebopus sp. FC_14]|nr:N-acetyltransferase B complex non catalytic subunit-domain-containing protein [Phlebopus sp. FC_14]